MKISINYDLLSKIKEAKLGFSLQKCVKKVSTVVCIQTAIYSSSNVLAGEPIFDEFLLAALPFWIIYDMLLSYAKVRRFQQQ